MQRYVEDGGSQRDDVPGAPGEAIELVRVDEEGKGPWKPQGQQGQGDDPGADVCALLRRGGSVEYQEQGCECSDDRCVSDEEPGPDTAMATRFHPVTLAQMLS